MTRQGWIMCTYDELAKVLGSYSCEGDWSDVFPSDPAIPHYENQYWAVHGKTREYLEELGRAIPMKNRIIF